LAASRERMNELVKSARMLSHAMVIPNEGIDWALGKMERDAAELGVRAWKCYTPWGQIPAEVVAELEQLSEDELILMAAKGEIYGTGWRLDDPEVGIPFIEKGLALGVPIFCCHKGLPLPTFDPAFTGTDDLAAVAAAYSEARFVCYHSAYCAGASSFLERLREGPYEGPDADPEMAGRGINNLIDSLLDFGLGPDSNVYAELGGLWSSVYADPVQAQHVIGKLLKYLGPNRILWGTDAIWIGAPQPFIEAFRAFQITEEFQETYGYPPITAADKARILGLNAAELYGVDPTATYCAVAADDLAARREQFRARRSQGLASVSRPLGPRSRREFIRNWWSNPNSPA
jgi:predicted TIM-barrel fold metal-dependent hydrolase